MSVPRSVQQSEQRRRRWLFIAIAALATLCVAFVAAAPWVIAYVIERQLRIPVADAGARTEVEHVSLAWPGRLRVEGFRLRLAADAEPSVTVKSAEVRVAPLRWLLGEDFLQVTLVSPRVLLRRRAEGTFDLIEYLWTNGPADSELLEGLSARVAPAEPDDSTEADPDFTPKAQDADAAGNGAALADGAAMDSSPWVRANDPFSLIGGSLTIEDGSLSIVDSAPGQRTELVDVAATVCGPKGEQLLTFSLSARQRGREGREGAVLVQGRMARTSAGRFWLEYDGSEFLRAIDLDVRGRLAPCVVGDLDIGGQFNAAVHDAHATANVDGTLNGGALSFRLDAHSRARGLSPVGDVHLEMRDVSLTPAFAPLLAQINPLFDVGNGMLEGRVDSVWDGGWPDAPISRQRVRLRGSLAVRDLVLSEAPLVTSILRALGEGGRQLHGDLVAPEIRWEDGRVSYDRMAVTGDHQLTFAGTIADNGALRLTYEFPVTEAAAPRLRDLYPGLTTAVGTSWRVPVVGWVDAPRLRTPASVRAVGTAAGEP